ncbi:hypothetical protein GA0070608_6119 [Micromonospora peucetia]|uniref:Uncharacterized protein n=1 Tax=Micromonospora peucetia TaxID=47871 RepID=A0A1C6W5E2_9ACTN|nr:hypothetical protein GA0070608_6119 [Micromonospora peucetia]
MPTCRCRRTAPDPCRSPSRRCPALRGPTTVDVPGRRPAGVAPPRRTPRQHPDPATPRQYPDPATPRRCPGPATPRRYPVRPPRRPVSGCSGRTAPPPVAGAPQPTTPGSRVGAGVRLATMRPPAGPGTPRRPASQPRGVRTTRWSRPRVGRHPRTRWRSRLTRRARSRGKRGGNASPVTPGPVDRSARPTGCGRPAAPTTPIPLCRRSSGPCRRPLRAVRRRRHPERSSAASRPAPRPRAGPGPVCSRHGPPTPPRADSRPAGPGPGPSRPGLPTARTPGRRRFGAPPDPRRPAPRCRAAPRSAGPAPTRPRPDPPGAPRVPTPARRVLRIRTQARLVPFGVLRVPTAARLVPFGVLHGPTAARLVLLGVPHDRTRRHPVPPARRPASCRHRLSPARARRRPGRAVPGLPRPARSGLIRSRPARPVRPRLRPARPGPVRVPVPSGHRLTGGTGPSRRPARAPGPAPSGRPGWPGLPPRRPAPGPRTVRPGGPSRHTASLGGRSRRVSRRCRRRGRGRTGGGAGRRSGRTAR